MCDPEVASGMPLKRLECPAESASTLYRNKLATLLEEQIICLAIINEIFEIVTAFYKRK